ncbi:hypothetical protein [uncultured Methanoregula sp.]|nr:hypothetical protein [uncultured Methanoregula sp.]
MTLTQNIKKQSVFLRACEGVPLMIAAIVLLYVSAYILKKSW